MTKIEALKSAGEYLAQRIAGLAGVTPAGLVPALRTELAQAQGLLAEVGAHQKMLEYAEYACELGPTGRQPDGWADYSGGRAFDYYGLVAEALGALPGGGSLSPALHAYLAELPRQQQAAHEELMEWLLEVAQQEPPNGQHLLLHSSLLDEFNQLAGQPTGALLPPLAHLRAGTLPGVRSPLADLTPEQLRRFSSAVFIQQLERTAFAESYAADVARAREVARQRGDWAEIQDLLA